MTSLGFCNELICHIGLWTLITYSTWDDFLPCCQPSRCAWYSLKVILRFSTWTILHYSLLFVYSSASPNTIFVVSIIHSKWQCMLVECRMLMSSQHWLEAVIGQGVIAAQLSLLLLVLVAECFTVASGELSGDTTTHCCSWGYAICTFHISKN